MSRTLFHNARIYSMEDQDKTYCGILVEKGMITEVFNKIPEINDVEKIDLEGAFVYPGFIDTHTHCFEGGLYAISTDLAGAENIPEVLDLLAKAEPISGKIYAYQFDENLVKEKRFPTATELDIIFPDTPVLIRRIDGHSCAINSAAARKIPWKTKLPSGFDGHLNQQWNGMASNWFHADIPNEGVFKAYQKAANIALRTGHTLVHTMVGDGRSDLKHFEYMKQNLNQFPVEFILYPQITDIDQALKISSPRIGGCILADGSFGSHTAALLSPYSDAADTSGILYRSDDFWDNFITRAHENNLQIAIHCIGDAAISQILKFYEKVQNNDPKDLRHAIIHNELTSDDMLDRMQNLGVMAVMQPMFDRLWGGKNGLYENRLGKERTSRTNRFRSIADRGITITGGSDWYITEINALKGIDAACCTHNPKESLTRYQAVEIYTKNAARLSHDEDHIGTLKPGLQADFVCLEKDIFENDNIADIIINRVIKKGKVYTFSK